ncbi:MAG: hypothetical protein A3I05_02495 [Deltaproteobacteria bacterium RIFCSPLOWO2_02_FULL_44_10]|nr:MAG: hypothetical protein A3C46_03575 [Deltaproteobacteria bacterium RIFCSPHIGHO2_02_FULL_44_16]OGQ47722.1 MAG: hypothetical protein A3I05_02495 [Deltaproteobacteria bacterium RIFCSPLOWO2_02_FULL_44_10]
MAGDGITVTSSSAKAVQNVTDNEPWGAAMLEEARRQVDPSEDAWIGGRVPVLYAHGFMTSMLFRGVNMVRLEEIAAIVRNTPLSFGEGPITNERWKTILGPYLASVLERLGLHTVTVQFIDVSPPQNLRISSHRDSAVPFHFFERERVLRVYVGEFERALSEMQHASVKVFFERGFSSPQNFRSFLGVDSISRDSVESVEDLLAVIVRRELGESLSIANSQTTNAEAAFYRHLRGQPFFERLTPSQRETFVAAYAQMRRDYFWNPFARFGSGARDQQAHFIFLQEALFRRFAQTAALFRFSEETFERFGRPFVILELERINRAELAAALAVRSPQYNQYSVTGENTMMPSIKTARPSSLDLDVERLHRTPSYTFMNNRTFLASSHALGLTASSFAVFDVISAANSIDDPVEDRLDVTLNMTAATAAIGSSTLYVTGFLLPGIPQGAEVLGVARVATSGSAVLGSATQFAYGIKHTYDDMRDFEITSGVEKASSVSEMLAGGAGLAGGILLFIGTGGTAAVVLVIGGIVVGFTAQGTHAEAEENRVAENLFKAMEQQDRQRLQYFAEDERHELDDDAIVDLFEEHILPTSLFQSELWRSEAMGPIRIKILQELGGKGWMSYMGDSEAAYRLFVALHHSEKVAQLVASEMERSDWNAFFELQQKYFPELSLPSGVAAVRMEFISSGSE